MYLAVLIQFLPTSISFQKPRGVSGSPCTINYDVGSIFVLNIGYRAGKKYILHTQKKITKQLININVLTGVFRFFNKLCKYNQA
jgi:hypothetical protein